MNAPTPTLAPVRLAPRSMVQVAARLVALAALAGQLAVAARFLAPVDLGSLVAALAVLGIAGAFSEFGLTNTIVLSLTRGRAPGAVLSDAIRASVILCVLAIVGAGLVAWLVLGDDLSALVFLLPWFVASRAAIPLIGFAQWQHRFARIATADALGRLSAVGVTILAWLLGGSLPGDARLALVAGGLLIGSLVSLRVLMRIGVRPTPGGSARTLIKDALPIGLTNGASYVHSRIDQVVLGAFGYRRALAAYGVAYRVVDASLAAALGIATIALPVLGRAEPEDRAEIGDMLGGFVGALALVLGVLVFWFAEPIVVILGGEQYRSAASLLRLLSPVLVISLLNMVPAHLALVHDRASTLMRIAVVLLVLNVGANLVLVPAHQAKGAAVASIITESIGLLCVSWVAARSIIGGLRWVTTFGTVAAFLLMTVGAEAAEGAGPALAVAAGLGGVLIAALVLVHPLRLLIEDARRAGPQSDAAAQLR